MTAGFTKPRNKPWQGVGQERATQVVMVPPPAGGITAVQPYAQMDPNYCISAINLISDGTGMKVRTGYTDFASNLNGSVRCIIPFIGATTNALHAVTEDGIINITAGGSGPWVPDTTFGVSTSSTGWGVWTNYVSDGGTHYALYADEDNGLYRCQEGGAWAAVTDITGVNEANLAFVTQHNGRLWFAEKNSSSAWYLAAGAISGAATRFYFGNKFSHGGTLVAMYVWTVDGGNGVDDLFVAVGSGGDVIVYKGHNPDDASSWEQVGQYYVGRLPAGRRVANDESGELYIISQYGVIPLSRLITGQLVQQESTQLSKNIAPLVADSMKLTITLRGWELRNVPSENAFFLSRPDLTGFQPQQFVLSTRTNGWTIYNGLPYQTGDTFDGVFYFGDSDGNVWTLTGTTDNGDAITFGMVTSFQEYGAVGLYKRAQFMRPVFLASNPPTYALTARYDYHLDLPDLTGTAPIISGALWDVALWDEAMWSSSGAVAQSVVAASGIGRAVAIAIRGSASSETNLIRIDLMLDTGGPL